MDVFNGGLGLLGLLLQPLFAQFGCPEQPQFQDAVRTGRAVHLPQFQEIGSEDAPEHPLVLNGLLCGIQRAQVPGAWRGER